MSSKYLAPPPWTVEEGPRHLHWTNSISVFDADGGEVAVLTRGYEADADGEDCPSFANARLIAAAPKMLAALQAALPHLFNGICDGSRPGCSRCNAIIAAREVVAEALGEKS